MTAFAALLSTISFAGIVLFRNGTAQMLAGVACAASLA